MYRFTLIGHPLGHSMSPWIHERLFRLAGLTAAYTLTDIAPEDLAGSVDGLRRLRGFNVTIPYKTDILPHLKKLDETAERYQSVNTVAVNSDGELFGYNTDCSGFLHSVGEIPADSSVLLVGCGGVGRMMATECVLHGAALTVVERDLPRAQALAEERILGGALLLRGFRVTAFADQPAQCAAFFDAELVGADVLRAPFQHFVERLRQDGLRQL